MKAYWAAAIFLMTAACMAEPARFAISAIQVARTLSSSTLPIDESQVSLLSAVTAKESEPQLELLEVIPAKGADHPHSLVKIRCHAPQACLPFFALVDGEVSAPVKAVRAAAKDAPRLQPRPKIVMRAGAHATLMLDSDRARMQVAVISLENGALGVHIRVASLDRKEFFEGEVMGPNLLRGRF